jgi:hypothetical protein
LRGSFDPSKKESGGWKIGLRWSGWIGRSAGSVFDRRRERRSSGQSAVAVAVVVVVVWAAAFPCRLAESHPEIDDQGSHIPDFKILKIFNKTNHLTHVRLFC